VGLGQGDAFTHLDRITITWFQNILGRQNSKATRNVHRSNNYNVGTELILLLVSAFGGWSADGARDAIKSKKCQIGWPWLLAVFVCVHTYSHAQTFLTHKFDAYMP
jgi:hypothetical protein